jgi:prohibitin 1
MKKLLSIVFAAALITSCTSIRPGEIGVRSKFGQLKEPRGSGLVVYNPLTSKVIKIPTRTVNREVLINLPSKEGLTIKSEISILYIVKPEMMKQIITDIGLQFDEVISAVFRSAAPDISSKYFAKDMHSGERYAIEKEIADRMNSILNKKGFMIEAVLLKSIQLPAGLNQAIEAKLKAEQDAQRMEFTNKYETLEADRKSIQAEGDANARIIEARGERQIAKIRAEGKAQAVTIEAEAQAAANHLLSKSLTPMIIQSKQVDAYEALYKSNNSKVIITDGKTPLLGLPTH